MNSISVVIPTAGRTSLGTIREALDKQSQSPLEIIVIKDTERRGSAWARNQGFKVAKGDFIAFLDDDCVPYPDWLDKLASTMVEFEAGAVGGAYVEADPFYQEIQKRRNLPSAAEVDTRGRVGLGGNVMYQKKWLELCIQTYGHLFDENLNSGQDFELAFRVRELGAKFVFVPANPLHLRQVSPFTFQKIQFLRGYGIYCIWRCTRSKNLHPSQPSLLWDQSGSKGSSRWLLPVFTKKMVGPFDRSSFSNWNYFF